MGDPNNDHTDPAPTLIRIEAHDQVSPDDEQCERCDVVIPAGDSYHAFTTHRLASREPYNICPDCFPLVMKSLGTNAPRA